MTTEQLRLEIQVQVKEALANLKATSAEYKNLATEAARAAPATHELQAAMASLEHDLKTSAQTAKLFGDEAGGLKEQQARLKQEIRDLIDKGLAPESKEVQDLKSRYDQTTQALQRHGGGVDELKGKLESMLSMAALGMATKKLADFVGSAVTDFAGAEAAAQRLDLALEMRGMQSAKQPLADLASKLQELTGVGGDLVAQLEAELIAQGKSREETEKTITAAAGLSAVTGDDLSTSVQQLSSTYAGQARTLGAMIPEIKSLTEEQLRSGAAVDLVAQKYTGYIGKTGTTQIAIKSMNEALGDAKETFGSIFAPVVSEVAGRIASLAKALSEASPVVKTLAGVVTAVLFGALVGWTARAVILTAAKWGLFGAQTAVNAASAAMNPLLWAGIAAAGAAVIATTALVAAKVKEANALKDGAAGARDEAAAFDEASASIVRLSRLKTVTEDVSRLRKDLSALQADMKNAPTITSLPTTGMGMASYSALKKIDPRVQQEEDLKKKIAAVESEISQLMKEKRNQEVADAEKAAALRAEIEAKRAQELKEQMESVRSKWADEFQKYTDETSANPYAALNTERMNALEEAFAAGIKADDPIISQISTIYNYKINQLGAQLAKANAEATAKLAAEEKEKLQSILDTMARISETRMDDLEIEKRKALEGFKGTEEQKQQLAAYYAKQIADTKIEEDARAAAAAFDATNQERTIAAKLTESQMDDLEIARDRELALFIGTEEEKAAIAKKYAKEIADSEVAEKKRAFEEELVLAKKNGDYGTYGSLYAQQQAASTDVGQLAGIGGMVAADPITMLIEDLVEMALSIENVQKVLNPFGTILDAALVILEPLVNGSLEDLVLILEDMGYVFGEVMSPFVSILGIAFKLVAGILKVTLMPVLEIVGAAFVWLNNKIIVPVGNAFIAVINGVIKGINFFITTINSWLGTSIATISLLSNLTEVAVATSATADTISDSIDDVEDAMDDVRDIFEEKKDDIQEAYDANITSLKDLLEAGAISAAEYNSMVDAYNTQLNADLDSLDEAEDAQLAALQDLEDTLNDGIAISNLQTLIDAILSASNAKVAQYAVGASEIPATQLALVHQGEMIIPQSFAEGIRSGTVSLGTSSGTTNLTTVSVVAKGSIVAEKNLVAMIAKATSKAGNRGTLPAEALN